MQFTASELIEATGWKKVTFKTYLTKGQLSDFISEVSDDLYEASNCIAINDVEFAKLLSQSKHRRGLGHNFKSKFAKALLLKANDGFYPVYTDGLKTVDNFISYLATRRLIRGLWNRSI